MQCADAIEALRVGSAEEAAAARAHAVSCPVCMDLVGAEERPSAIRLSTARLSADAFASVDAAVQRERGPLYALRGLSTPLRRALALGAAALTAVGVLIATPRADMAVYPALRLLALAALWSGLLGLCVWRALPSDARPHPAPRAVALAVIVALASPWLAPLLPLAHSAHPASIGGVGAELWPKAIACLLFGAATALPIAAVVWLASRGPRPLSALSLALFAGAGLSGVLALHLHCPLVHPDHLAAGHATVPLLVVLVGLVARLTGLAKRST